MLCQSREGIRVRTDRVLGDFLLIKRKSVKGIFFWLIRKNL